MNAHIMNTNVSQAALGAETFDGANDRSIGAIIQEIKNLSAEQIEQALRYQKEHNCKFGEAAVALGLAKPEDVLWALSRQFHYPYSGDRTSEVSGELVLANSPFSDEAEAFRDIRSQLVNSVFSSDDVRCALAVVSANTGDGKSFFAANMAVAFSQLGGRTLLVDADLRTPRQHEIFGIENPSGGLSGVLSGRNETNVIRPVDALPSLYVLPVGTIPPNPQELVQRHAFSLLLNELLTKFDHVIVDTPAASHGSDARVIAAKCGSAVVIGRKGKTPMQQIQALSNSIGKGPAKIVGVILNEF